MLSLSGLPPEAIQSKSVKVGTDKDGKPITMRTHVINPSNFSRDDKPKLVFLHGYAASGCIYYSLFPALHDAFCTIFVDQIGMGSSSRPDDFDRYNFTAEQVVNYFVDYLERWRVGFSNSVGLDFRDFYLLGHSFSGYVCGHYTLKYPQHVKKLILISPIGIRPEPEEESSNPSVGR